MFGQRRKEGLIENNRGSRKMKEKRDFQTDLAGLVGWVILCFLAAATGGAASANAGGFYGELMRPSWAPPGWVFGPVWTVLYAMMAVSAWLVWRQHRFRGAPAALSLFVVQLGANALWTWIFFVWRMGFFAFAEILVLLVLIITVTEAFRRKNRLAALLLVPYIAWTAFATVLSFTVWKLNPALLG